ncbi:MAG TPA: hypothetical protein VJ650_16120 [Gemmatimonadaceae bacterium]|nr:hypothetical protein [Gemmatimonadaceae bacterium]
MSVQSLDEKDQTLVRRCLEFILETQELEGEFETRIGVGREEIRNILARWPDAGDELDGSSATTAINNTLNEIAHGLHIAAADEHAIGQSRGGVQALYWRWARGRGWTATGLR